MLCTLHYSVNGYINFYKHYSICEVVSSQVTQLVLQNVGRYQAMATGAETLESRLKEQLAEYLNAEIVLLTVSTDAQATQWLKGTFLYVRVSEHHYAYRQHKDL